MTTNDFWNSTLDEIVTKIRGKVYEWRIQRNNAYLIHCSLIPQKDRAKITEASPLPFDDELDEPTDTTSNLELYEEAKRAGLV